jgi:uncharacterized protein YndB with AHSA1/START domain
MKWVIIAALSLAGVVLLVILIGALLPRKHVVARSVSLHQPPETVWKLITGPPAWRPDIKGFEELPANNGHRMWRETDEHGHTITYETVESVAPSRLVTRIADPKLPFGGTWTYEITPTGSGCSLTITENGEVYNPLFRFASRFVMGHEATINAYLKALTAKLA